MNEKQLSLDRMKEFTGYILEFNKPWSILLALFFVMSLFDIGANKEGMNLHIEFSSISLSLICLLWLPALLKIVALFGGGIKFGGNEASSKGLLELFPEIIQSLEEAEAISTDEEQKQKLRALSARTEQAVIESNFSLDFDGRTLEDFIKEYDKLRKEMPSCHERTKKMGMIVTGIRAITKTCTYTAENIRSLFNQGTNGSRMAALTILSDNYFSDCFDLVLEGLTKSKSAYEQFRALIIANKVAPFLESHEKDQLRSALQSQMSNKPGAYLNDENKDRQALGMAILKKLK